MWCVMTAYQKAVREQRLATEISAAKRERDFYLSRVDKAKAIAAQQERKRKVCLSKSLQRGCECEAITFSCKGTANMLQMCFVHCSRFLSYK